MQNTSAELRGTGPHGALIDHNTLTTVMKKLTLFIVTTGLWTCTQEANKKKINILKY